VEEGTMQVHDREGKRPLDGAGGRFVGSYCHNRQMA
jgi:hypothetical protein